MEEMNERKEIKQEVLEYVQQAEGEIIENGEEKEEIENSEVGDKWRKGYVAKITAVGGKYGLEREWLTSPSKKIVVLNDVQEGDILEKKTASHKWAQYEYFERSKEKFVKIAERFKRNAYGYGAF